MALPLSSRDSPCSAAQLAALERPLPRLDARKRARSRARSLRRQAEEIERRLKALRDSRTSGAAAGRAEVEFIAENGGGAAVRLK